MDPTFQPQSKKWPLSRKQTLFFGGGLVLLLIIIITAILVALLGANKDTPQTSTPLRHERPGYDLNKLGSGTADPFAVKFMPNDTAVSHKNNKVVQACNVLTVDDVTKQGLFIKANTLSTPIARVINDGVGKGDYEQKISASSLSGLSLGADINSCTYVLESDDEAPTIVVNAFQPFTVSEKVIDDRLKTYTASSSIEGLEVFTKQASATDRTEYIVRQRGNGAFYLSLGTSQADKKQALLAAAAKNFVREQSNPTGVSTLTYDSPVFPKSIARACELLTNDEVRTLSGRDAGPLARENIASSIGTLIFSNFNDDTPYPYITNECTRSTTGGGSGLSGDGLGNFSLGVETTSFLTTAPAKHAVKMQEQKGPNNRESLALKEQVGDGGVAYTSASGDFRIIFSKGRFVVELSLEQQSTRTAGVSNLAQAAEKLTPITKAMAERVKD
jgi:hypothetical protein